MRRMGKFDVPAPIRPKVSDLDDFSLMQLVRGLIDTSQDCNEAFDAIELTLWGTHEYEGSIPYHENTAGSIRTTLMQALENMKALRSKLTMFNGAIGKENA